MIGAAITLLTLYLAIGISIAVYCAINSKQIKWGWFLALALAWPLAMAAENIS
jgi:hypothetical protein